MRVLQCWQIVIIVTLVPPGVWCVPGDGDSEGGSSGFEDSEYFYFYFYFF